MTEEEAKESSLDADIEEVKNDVAAEEKNEEDQESKQEKAETIPQTSSHRTSEAPAIDDVSAPTSQARVPQKLEEIAETTTAFEVKT